MEQPRKLSQRSLSTGQPTLAWLNMSASLYDVCMVDRLPLRSSLWLAFRHTTYACGTTVALSFYPGSRRAFNLNTLPVKMKLTSACRIPGDLSVQSWTQGTPLCPDLEVQELPGKVMNRNGVLLPETPLHGNAFPIGAQRPLIVSYRALYTGPLSVSRKTGFQNVGSEESQQHLQVS